MNESERVPSVLITQLFYPFLLIVIAALVQGAISYYFMREQGIESAKSAEQASELQAKNIEIQLDAQEKAINAKFERQLELIEAQQGSIDERQELTFRQQEDSAESERVNFKRDFCITRAEELRAQKTKVYDELSHAIISFKKSVLYGPFEFLLSKKMHGFDKAAQKISLTISLKKIVINRDILDTTLSKTIPFFGDKTKKSVLKLRIALDSLVQESAESAKIFMAMVDATKDISASEQEEFLSISFQHLDSYKFQNEIINELIINMANEVANAGLECVK